MFTVPPMKNFTLIFALLILTIQGVAAGPAGELLRQSNDWGKPLERFQEHAYLSDVGEPSKAPESDTETWIQHLSGTDKDHTVAWDFYCTDGRNKREWSKIQVPSNWGMQGFRHHQQGDKQVVEVVYNGNMKSATWTLFPSGWLQLDCGFTWGIAVMSASVLSIRPLRHFFGTFFRENLATKD